MKILPENAQHIGSREEQQDAFGFSDFEDTRLVAHGGMLSVLADGMGGLAMGREASQIATDTFISAYSNKAVDEPIPVALRRSVAAANRSVFDLAESAQLTGDVGTTVVAAVVHGETLHFVSVGDSHIYVIRDGTLKLLTEDHTYGRFLDAEVELGRIDVIDAREHPERHALTSFLGLQDVPELSEGSYTIRSGDLILLCSDGLYGALEPAEIEEIISRSKPGDVAQELVDSAIQRARPNQDNVTVAVLSATEANAGEGRGTSFGRRIPGGTTTMTLGLTGAAFLLGVVVTLIALRPSAPTATTAEVGADSLVSSVDSAAAGSTTADSALVDSGAADSAGIDPAEVDSSAIPRLIEVEADSAAGPESAGEPGESG